MSSTNIEFLVQLIFPDIVLEADAQKQDPAEEEKQPAKVSPPPQIEASNSDETTSKESGEDVVVDVAPQMNEEES
eukprot:m.3434 g.3434  ORF g.3434 m.3434 type:complete len:75 (+) comp3983_c0_seq1:318-542(+)